MKNKFIKKVVILLILTLIGTTAVYAGTGGASVSVPADVSGTKYEAAVQGLMDKEIITGDTDGLFHPDSNLTRAQACIIAVKSMNPPAAEVTGTATQPAGKSGFSDMSGYGWAEGYISYAVEHGVTNGYPDGTFKPGKNVTVNELLTMVLRAAGYTDKSIGGTWPSNYITKAAELDLLKNIPSPLPVLATKGMAAQMDYNALDKITAANPPAVTPGQGTDQDKPASLPDSAAMTYANASFNSEMTNYGGKTISDNAVIYTYGEKADYSNSLTFSKKIADYRIDTVYKYKNVKTPAFYKLENGKITEMIVPMDVGFTGKAYGVINDTLTSLNAQDETVPGLSTLTAANEITWLGKEGLTGIPMEADYLKGELYELNLTDGQIKSIFMSSDLGKKGAVFEEISGTANLWDNVESVEDGVVTIAPGDGGAVFEVKDNASVYILDKDDPTEYTTGRISSVKAGVQIRAYDVSDDDEASADVIVVLK